MVVAYQLFSYGQQLNTCFFIDASLSSLNLFWTENNGTIYGRVTWLVNTQSNLTWWQQRSGYGNLLRQYHNSQNILPLPTWYVKVMHFYGDFYCFSSTPRSRLHHNSCNIEFVLVKITQDECFNMVWGGSMKRARCK